MQKALSSPRPITVSGRTFSKEEIISIGKVVTSCNGLSRNELGLTVCELLEWERDNGKLKSRDCWDLLNQLNDRGDIALPALRAGRPKGKKTTVSHTESGEERASLPARSLILHQSGSSLLPAKMILRSGANY